MTRDTTDLNSPQEQHQSIYAFYFLCLDARAASPGNHSVPAVTKKRYRRYRERIDFVLSAGLSKNICIKLPSRRILMPLIRPRQSTKYVRKESIPCSTRGPALATEIGSQWRVHMQLHLLQLILYDSISGPKKVPVARQTGRLESPNSVTDCRLPTAEHHDTSMTPRFEEGSVDFGSASWFLFVWSR